MGEREGSRGREGVGGEGKSRMDEEGRWGKRVRKERRGKGEGGGGVAKQKQKIIRL